MNNKTKWASIAAIVYILTWMWIIQDAQVVWLGRMFLAGGFFFTILVVYDLTENKNKKQ